MNVLAGANWLMLSTTVVGFALEVIVSYSWILDPRRLKKLGKKDCIIFYHWLKLNR